MIKTLQIQHLSLSVVESGDPDYLLSGVHHRLTEDFAAGKLEAAKR